MKPVALPAATVMLSILGVVALDQHLGPAALALETDLVFAAQARAVFPVAHRTSKLGHNTL